MTNDHTVQTRPENSNCANPDCNRFRPDLNEGDRCRICRTRDVEVPDDYAEENEAVTEEETEKESEEDSGNCPDCGGFWDGTVCTNCGYEA